MRIVTKFLISQAGCRKWLAHRRALQPFGVWWTHIDDRVMNKRAARRPHFRHLHPVIFGEAGRYDLVRIFDIALGWDRDRLWHGDNIVGLRNVPAWCPVRRRRRVMRIA